LFSGFASEAGLFDVNQSPSFFLGMGSGFVERNGFARLNAQGPCGAYTQAEASAVAQFFTDDPGFAIDQFDRSLGTGSHTQPTAVAQLFIDANDGSDHSFHGVTPLLSDYGLSIGGNYAVVYDFCQLGAWWTQEGRCPPGL
jgi:hypothetical protein